MAGLYLHVPFCSSICPYCDFAVMKGDRARRGAFVAALVDEIALWSDEGRRFDTVYFGGGTPSLLTAEEMEQVLAALERHVDLGGSARFALEVNPEDVTAASAAAWRRLGFTTVSLGVQSFAERELEFLGRRHTARESIESIETARSAGFETVSIDLISALPGQTLDAWRATLGQAIALGPDHLSCYQLTVHEKTVFGVRRRRGELEEMADDDQADLFFVTHRELTAAGYEGYEVSNFARAPEHRSAHNMKYWDHTAYLGLGPSAHSFDGARRWWNERKERVWRRRVDGGERPIAGGETLTAVELVVERLLLGLRTRAGVDLAELTSRYGVDLERPNAELIERLVASGAVERRGSRLKPTLDGMAVADSLAAAFEVGAESGAAEASFVPA